MRPVEVGWRIAERRVVVDWSRDLGRPTSWSAPATAHFVGGVSTGRVVVSTVCAAADLDTRLFVLADA
jgi:hypothetical protein